MEESPIPSDTTHRTLAACRTRLSQCFRFSACEGCHVLLFWHAESLPLGNLVSSWQRTTSLVTELLSNCFQQFQPIPINTKSTPCTVPEASHPRAPDPARPLTQATLQADGEPRRGTSGPQGWFAWRAAFTPNVDIYVIMLTVSADNLENLGNHDSAWLQFPAQVEGHRWRWQRPTCRLTEKSWKSILRDLSDNWFAWRW